MPKSKSTRKPSDIVLPLKVNNAAVLCRFPAPPDCPDPVAAVTAQTQFFPSGKVAFKAWQLVTLEFTPSMVIVHDPNEMGQDSLGRILFTYSYSKDDQPYTPRHTADCGEVKFLGQGRMQFLILRIKQQDGKKECLCCGRTWLDANPPTQDEMIGHLRLHLQRIPKVNVKPQYKPESEPASVAETLA